MTKPSPCILDCDPGIDDTLAILHAMGSPRIDLKAITLCYGNTNRQNVVKNLFTILHVLGKEVSAERLATLPPGADRERLEQIRTKRPVIAAGKLGSPVSDALQPFATVLTVCLNWVR
jgi:inosine-uridine nucleoside N-ribohydrolase